MAYIYLVIENVKYEGNTIWGAFDTEEKALEQVKRLEEYLSKKNSSSITDIFEMELNKCYENGFVVYRFVEAFKKIKGVE